MSNYSWEQFDEVFNMPMLNTFRTDYRFKLEITLNYPRDCKFKRLVPASKIKLYEGLLSYIISHNSFIKSQKVTIEYCKDGTPHLHALLDCQTNVQYSIEGVCNDVVNTYISQLPKRTQLTLFKYHYCPLYTCFKTPSIFVRWVDEDNTQQSNRWSDYITKTT